MSVLNSITLEGADMPNLPGMVALSIYMTPTYRGTSVFYSFYVFLNCHGRSLFRYYQQRSQNASYKGLVIIYDRGQMMENIFVAYLVHKDFFVLTLWNSKYF